MGFARPVFLMLRIHLGQQVSPRCLEQIRAYPDHQKWDVYSTEETIACFTTCYVTVTSFPGFSQSPWQGRLDCRSLESGLRPSEKSNWRMIIEPNAKGGLCKPLGKQGLAQKILCQLLDGKCPFLPLPLLYRQTSSEPIRLEVIVLPCLLTTGGKAAWCSSRVHLVISVVARVARALFPSKWLF